MFDHEPLWKRILLSPLILLNWLGGLFSSMTQGFERKLGSVNRQLTKVVDVAGQGDSFLTRIFSWIFYPIRLLFTGFWALIEKLNLKPFVLGVVRYTKWLWYPFFALFAFIKTWIMTRRRDIVFWFIPVAIFVLPILAIVGFVTFRPGTLTKRYRAAMADASASGDNETANFYRLKLEQLGANFDRIELDRAERFMREGKIDEAMEIFRSIAPLDEAGGNALAHLQLANYYLQEGENYSLELCEQHLNRVKEQFNEKIDAAEFIDARIAIARKDNSKAVRILDDIQERYLPAAQVKFRIEQVLKRPNELRRSAEIIAKLYPRVEAPQPIDLEMALLANQLLGRFDEAKGILEQWRQMYPEDKNRTQFEQMYGIDQLVRMVDSNRDFSADEILTEIAKLGVVAEPGVAQLYGRLVNYMVSKASEKPVYAEVIERMVDAPDADGVVLTAAGTDAMMKENYSRGRQLLQRATEKSPDQFAGWNNLAVVIHQAFPEDIDAALRAANKAHEIAPRNDNVLETRGMILIDLKRWQEAVDDLELALNSRQGDKKIHKALATAYRNLGREQLAKIHEAKSR